MYFYLFYNCVHSRLDNVDTCAPGEKLESTNISDYHNVDTGPINFELNAKFDWLATNLLYFIAYLKFQGWLVTTHE
jgi:hypothetical protein